MTNLFTLNKGPFYKEWPFAFLVMAVLVLWVLFSLTSCREQDPPQTPEEMMQGAWVRTWTPHQAVTAYNFHAGACDACVSVPTLPVQCYEYAYHFDEDTLVMFDLVGLQTTKAIATFPTDTTARLFTLPLGIEINLKRI